MTVRTPASTTDPYAPEPSETQPVVVRLDRLDGTSAVVVSDVRVMRRHVLIKHDGRYYSFRADDEGNGRRWCKVFRECEVLEVGS